MNISCGTKINQLLGKVSMSGLIFSEWLSNNGYSSQLQKVYRDSGWLTSLCKGVMYRTGNRLNAYDALASYNMQMNGKMRIAAMSALEYSGFNHYVPMGKPVLTVCFEKNIKCPLWMKSDSFDMVFRTFSTTALQETETIRKETDSGLLYVSSPEQAFIECLLLAPKLYAYIDLYYIMEQLTTLRPEVVQHLLEKTDNLRVKRMFLYMAEKAGHYWLADLNTGKIDLGSCKLQLATGGVYNAKYKITIPKELEEYEG